MTRRTHLPRNDEFILVCYNPHEDAIEEWHLENATILIAFNRVLTNVWRVYGPDQTWKTDFFWYQQPDRTPKGWGRIVLGGL